MITEKCSLPVLYPKAFCEAVLRSCSAKLPASQDLCYRLRRSPWKKAFTISNIASHFPNRRL